MVHDKMYITRKKKELRKMEKVINYLFDEEEMELVPMYATLLKIAMVSAVVTILAIML